MGDMNERNYQSPVAGTNCVSGTEDISRSIELFCEF